LITTRSTAPTSTPSLSELVRQTPRFWTNVSDSRRWLLRHTGARSRESVHFLRFWKVAGPYLAWEYRYMAVPKLSELLKLSSQERAELALALWESLTDAERHAEFSLTPEDEAELDR